MRQPPTGAAGDLNPTRAGDLDTRVKIGFEAAFFGGFGNVDEKMPPVRDLDRLRRAEPRGLGARSGWVPADDGDVRMRGKPIPHRRPRAAK